MKRLFILLISAGLIINTHAQTYVNVLDEALTQATEKEVFAGQVLIGENGNIEFSNAYGLQGEDKITDDTPILVYSLGKSFTVSAILLLQQRGKLNITNSVSDYLPGFTDKNVSIKQLMNMTSGLPNILSLMLPAGDTLNYISNNDLIPVFKKYNVKGNNPGARFTYNNINYYVLATIIEKVSGKRYGDFMKANVFIPLGMTNTYNCGYQCQTNGKKITADNFLALSGAGSIYSTAEDLFKYDQALYGDKWLTEESKELMFTTTQLKDGSESNYALGCRINDGDWGREISYVGDGVNVRASVQRWPEARKTLVYFHVESNEYYKGVYWAVRNIWEGKDYELPTKREKYAIDPMLFEKYVGSYLTGFGLVHVSTENGRLYLRPDPIPGKEELVPSSETTFYFANQNIEWEFFLNEKGEVAGFGIKGDRDNMGLPQEN